MHLFIDFGVQVLEWMFGLGLIISCSSIVLGTIDDIKTFIQY
jgi:hypothetical protein